MLELSPVKPKPCQGSNPSPLTLQLSVFGDPINVLPSLLTKDEPITLEPAAHPCPECVDYVYDTPTGLYEAGASIHTVPKLVTPVPLSDPSYGWIQYPCHQQECNGCYLYENVCTTCGGCEDHCSCVTCSSCGDSCDEVCDNCDRCSNCCSCETCAYCGYKDSYDLTILRCDHCIECGCSCGERSCSGWSIKKAGWDARGWTAPDDWHQSDASGWFRENYGRECDPTLSMVDFYLAEWVRTVVTLRIPQTASTPCWNGLRSARQIAQDAATIQSHIVNQLDSAFRAYAFLAIGGELRHHPAAGAANPAHGRDNTWDWWLALGRKYGTVELLRDAKDMFEDYGWTSGYGGERWAEITSIALARETGKLDARTFVDRCFSLQHNGGSFLDKLPWMDYTRRMDKDTAEGPWTFNYAACVDACKYIGDAHAADETNLRVLLSYATRPVRQLLLDRLVPAYGWKLTDRERDEIRSHYRHTEKNHEMADAIK